MSFPSIVQELYKLLLALAARILHNGNFLIKAAAIFALLIVLIQLWYGQSKRSLKLFVGSPGSSTSALGPLIGEQIELTRSPGGATYEISIESTSDNMSIREHMASVRNHYALGIVEDGDGFESSNAQASGLRALLPLEWDYMFVLCSKKLYKKVLAKGKVVNTLADVIDDVEPGTLYIGPEKSSTNKMARLAIGKYGGFAIDKIAKGIADWDEMRSALKREELQLVFAKGPLGSLLLQQVANDGSAILLDLGPITDAIQRESGFQVYSAELPPHLCSATELKVAGVPAFFCKPGIRTLASRRIIACSQSLSTVDAYLLATVAKRVCEDQQYNVNLMANDLPRGGDPGLAAELRMPVHAGLKLLQTDNMPIVLRDWRSWPTWFISLITAVGGYLVLDFLNWLLKRGPLPSSSRSAQSLAQPSPQPTDSLSGASTLEIDYEHLSTVLENYTNTIESQTHLETVSQMDDWHAKLRTLRTEIKLSKQLTVMQREILLSGVRELRMDIMSSLWIAMPASGPSGPKANDSPT